MSTTPRPGEKALSIMKLNEDVGLFKVPRVPPSKRKPKVLEEEQYLEEMGKIIQRDFFPDLEKLRAQNEYLDAVSQNDSEKMRELFTKYSSGKRPPTERFPSPATFETPQSAMRDNEATMEKERANASPAGGVNAGTDKGKSSGNGKGEKEAFDGGNDAGKQKKKIRLDQYLNIHTSEDNESFKEIQKESAMRHKMKYAWLYKDENDINKGLEDSMRLPSIEEQAAGGERPLAIDTWTYKNRNHCMYVPEGIEQSEEERVESLRKQREIVHDNTSFKQNPFDEKQNKDTIHELALNQARSQEGKIGVDGKIVTCNEPPSVNGFHFVKTPSPAPGVNESPLLTWGEIEGTPFRLDGGDTPYIASPGPKFRIPEIPKREKIAMALADKASESYRDRKRRAIEAARSQLQTPKRQSSTMDRLSEMSPAAQRLASASLGRRLGTDASLRDSYSPSPVLSKRLRSPYLTPSPKSPATPRTPIHASSPGVKLKNLVRRATPLGVTDDLLNLPTVRNTRPKAADFF